MPQGLSLHIGLNAVDPGKYEGWSGDLVACEQDANDMAALAAASGFTVQPPLLTRDATAEAVTTALTDAASRLHDGDQLFLTYSGHGGQVPDTNGDEPDRRDETWVLYDRQLIDDELYELYSAFEQGVRIVVLSDSCHSGSVARRLPDFLSVAALEQRFGTSRPEEVEKRVRALPRDIQDRLYHRDQKLYDGIQAARPAKDGREIGASVLLISGCQDNQTSADGEVNGLFTGTLLNTWNGGGFRGSYRALHRAIVAEMPPDQTPNLFLTGLSDPGFTRRRPFRI
ncbi:caspase family protein [Streptomyces sp. 21So2-11]|uniref:caspase family protein n=1 Tax=Streptomyces sp. 21So2-11 TaxID=3144408 RepID=UPI0032193709